MLLDLNSSLEIDHACCVDEGLNKLAAGHYDVVVSDYDMPQKNGLDFLRELRQRKNMVPFILFTGKGREDVAVTALNLGAEGYFHKQGSPETVYGELAHGINFVTEKAKAKSALEASEKRYFTLMNQAAEAIFIHDEKGKILDVNQQACKNLQYTREELLSRSIKDISVTAEEDGKYVSEVWLKVLAGNTISLQSTEIRKDKSKFPVEVTLTTISFDKEKLVIGLVRDVTERKKAEDDLKFSKEFSESVINSVDEVLLVIDVNDFSIVDANAAALKQTGCSKVELTGNTCYAMTHHKSVPCQPPNDICPVHEMIETGIPVKVEHKHFDKNSNELFVEVSVYPIRNVEGKIIQATHISRDITQTKNAREALRMSEERLRSIMTASPEGITICDFSGCIVDCSPAAAVLFGYESKEELVGINILDFIPKKDREFALLGMANPGVAKGIELIFVAKDGHEFPVEMSASVVLDCLGKPAHIMAIIKDITERKRQERKNKFLSDEVNSIVDGIGDLLFVMDKNRVITKVNKATCDAFKKKPEELIGKHCFEIVHGTKEAWCNCPATKTFETKQTVIEEVNNPNLGIHLLVTTSPILDEQGEVAQIIHIAKDISERKKAEAMIQRQNMVLSDIDKSHISQTKLGEK